MYFDTHAHYDDEAFDDDRYELIPALFDEGVELIVNPGVDLETSKTAMSFADKYEKFYFAAGWHPEEWESATDEAFEEMRQIAKHEKCVAIGEIGLDYYWDNTHKVEQKALFRRQIELALELDKPIIVHDREAHEDTIKILFDYPALCGVVHCYSGSAEMAKELLKRGWYLGFDGPITYKNARKNIEALEICPLDRFVIETDSPYLSPVTMRGKRNNSGNLKYIVDKIAEVKGISHEEAARLSLENGKRLYNIK